MKSIFLTLFLLTSYSPVYAGINFSAYGGGSSGSSNTTLSAGYDNSLDINDRVSIDYYFSAQAGRSQFTTSFVEGLAETQTKISKFGFSGGLTVFDLISVNYDYVNESVNENAVLAKEYTISPGLRLGNFSISYGYGKRKVIQQKPYIVLNRDIKDDIEFTQNSDRASMSYRFSDVFTLSLSHTRFKYDKNMESSYTVLSNTTLATNNGTDMLSQSYSILDSASDISGTYTFADMADVELSIGKTIDFYNPKSDSSDVRLGVMIYQTESFSWGIGVTSSRADSDQSPSRSYDGTLSYAF